MYRLFTFNVHLSKIKFQQRLIIELIFPLQKVVLHFIVY